MRLFRVAQLPQIQIPFCLSESGSFPEPASDRNYSYLLDGTLTTIAEDAKGFVFIGFNPSMNDLGQVSYSAIPVP